jgi:erythromycin esterase
LFFFVQFINQYKQAITIKEYTAFIQTIQPALDKMGAHKIVGLGEGTHGTAEFQTLRAYITRYLVEKKGFTTVCLENGYGWTIALNNYIQTGKGNLDTLMHQYLLGIWQNQETKALLEWMKQYNQHHAAKVQLTGMDYFSISPAAVIVSNFTRQWRKQGIDTLVSQLLFYSECLDDVYADMNRAKQKYTSADLFKKGVKGYEVVQALQQALQTVIKQLPVNDQHRLTEALYNCEVAFYSIYRPVKERKEASRDEAMANMVKLMADHTPSAKIIVWAHQAHVARKSIFEGDNNGGGAGFYLDRYFPQQYFVLGTGTAGGSVSVTGDAAITNTSRFATTSLPNAVDSSWEQKLMNINAGNLYIDCTNKQLLLPALKLRFTGYSNVSANDFVPARINELFDGFIFIKETQHTTIRQ